jgi:hypothetical protein
MGDQLRCRVPMSTCTVAWRSRVRFIPSIDTTWSTADSHRIATLYPYCRSDCASGGRNLFLYVVISCFGMLAMQRVLGVQQSAIQILFVCFVVGVTPVNGGLQMR